MKVTIAGSWVNSIVHMRTFVNDVEQIYEILKDYNTLEISATMELRIKTEKKAK